MVKRKKSKKIKFKLTRRILFVGIILAGGSGLVWQTNHVVTAALGGDPIIAAARADIRHDLNQLLPEIDILKQQQAKTGIKVVDNATIDQDLADVRLNDSINNIRLARQALRQLRSDVRAWNSEYSTTKAAQDVKVQSPLAFLPLQQTGTLHVPILLFHYTPADFEAQLQYLKAHNYMTIDFAQLVAALHHQAGLPAKPVIITFDDGFGVQMKAFDILQKYNMKATFYIIDGGPMSLYCIGANRTNQTCGDAYLSWDEIRQLDASGIITIGSHTIDHPKLTSLPLDQERTEIFEGKAQLERQLGHPVSDFAYPYGIFDATTISLVKQAGFTTAVTTQTTTFENLGNLYTMGRVPNIYALP